MITLLLFTLILLVFSEGNEKVGCSIDDVGCIWTEVSKLKKEVLKLQAEIKALNAQVEELEKGQKGKWIPLAIPAWTPIDITLFWTNSSKPQSFDLKDKKIPITAKEILVQWDMSIGNVKAHDPFCGGWLFFYTQETDEKQNVTTKYRKYGFVDDGCLYEGVSNASGNDWLPVTNDFHLYALISGYEGNNGRAKLCVIGYR